MTRLLALGLALLLAPSVLLVVWWSPAAKRSIEHGAPSAAVPAETSDRELLAPDDACAPERLEVPPSSVPHEAPRRAQPKDWPRITGRVVLPCSIPADEDVRVEAVVTVGRTNRVFDTPVATDGEFTLAVPKEATYAELDLRSRFLHMPDSVGARPGQSGVLLEPAVHALVEGEIVLPLARSAPSMHAMVVSWQVDRATPVPPRMRSNRGSAVVPDGDERFALEFLPVGVAIDLVVENPFGPPARLELEPLAPGEKRELEIALEEGITVSGRVIDESGAGVEGVTVVAYDGGRPVHARPDLTDRSTTDADGRFALRRVSSSVTRLTTQYAASTQLARGGNATIDGRAGDVHGVVLEVLRGGCIEGTVEWRDGSAPEHCSVAASARASFGSDAAAGGRFRVCQLTDALHVVEVHATRAGVAGSARVSGIRPGAAPLRIVLEEAEMLELGGTVVNADGEPIGADVEARGVGSTRRARASTFHDGSFVLSGLVAGEWSVEARADGRETVRQRVRVGPDGTPSLRFVLPYAGRIRGRVVDGAGNPVRGARVGGEDIWWTTLDSGSFGAGRLRAPRNETDSDGRFEVEGSAARVTLVARKEGFAPSQALELAVAPGATEDVLLTLRASSRVTGRVLDEQGKPLSRAWVRPAGDERVGASETDARGVFELTDLPPGALTLIAGHPVYDDTTASAEVVLVAGRESSVELRFERRDPVRVHGRITRGGRPLVVDVFLRSRSFEARAVSGADGRVELELQQPVSWSGLVVPASERACLEALDDAEGVLPCDVRRFELSVPDVDEHSFELELDALPRITSVEELLR